MNLIVVFLQKAIAQGIAILYGANGEIVTEKSGNLNLGVPGMMYMGGVAGLMGAFLYENSVESGDLNTARQVLKYLNQAEDGDRLWDKLYNWAKDAFMDAYDSGEYADLEKNLVSMGFSQKTINGWKD